jgi:hypothetical protein
MRIPAFMLYSACALVYVPITGQSVAAAEPTQPGILVPEVRYDSAFSDYVPYREPSLATWRKVNDEVGRVGGHVGMFGGGHGGHAGGKTALKPGPDERAKAGEGTGQSPARGAPAAPGSHTGH